MNRFFVITANPSDYPGKHVVRRHLVAAGQRVAVALVPHAVVDTLEEARATLPVGLTRVAPVLGDDPVIVETWL